MKVHFTILIALLIPNINYSQIPIGKWRDHYSFRQALHTAIAPNKVYAASSNGVFWVNISEGTIGKLTSANGLNDVGITAIGFSPYQDLLAVGYENGNIDLVFKNEVVNIPFIQQKPLLGSKQINDFFFDTKEQIFVSTGFGIVAVNILKREIMDTYYIGAGGAKCWVSQTLVYNDRIYAATSEGLLSANVDDPLLIHFANWFLENNIPHEESQYSALAVFDGNLIANQSTGGQIPDVIWYFDGFSWLQLNNQFTQVRGLWANSNKLIVTTRQGIGTYQSIPGVLSITNGYDGYPSFHPNSAVFDSHNNLVVADSYLSLMYSSNGSWTKVQPNGPDDDRSFYVLPTNEELFVMAGARSDFWGNRFYPLTFHRLLNNQWSTVSNFNYYDAVRITPSPTHSNEYYVSSWGDGVLVYRDGNLIEHYNPENSSLQTILPGSFCRVGGVVFDSKGNLWVSNAGVANPISLRTPDGSWTGFPYQNMISSQRQSDIVISPSGLLWVVIPSGGGFFVLDPGENPVSMSSHNARSFKPVEADGANLPTDIYSIAFDRDGYLWVGTTEGVLISYNPQRVLEPNLFGMQRLKIPDEVPGFAVYLLENQTVTAIAVDGGNRKWLGTQRSGVFLQSSDGAKQILHFTSENSPLPSNNIQHIGIHPKTGEVFFATDKGIVSYRGDSTEPVAMFGKVYAFPNPVRPNHQGPITITGLVDKTIVKITDIAGNLVFETISLGGQATWDGNNIRGQRVSTGVYLYFCSDSKGQQTAVGKILFVK